MTVDDAEVIALGVMYVVFVPALWAIFAWDERRMTAEQKAVRDEITAHFETLPREYQIMAQRDREALERLGVW